MSSEDEFMLDEFHWHEALDRTNLFSAIFDAHIVNHPLRTPHLKVKATRIGDLFADLYQEIGRVSP